MGKSSSFQAPAQNAATSGGAQSATQSVMSQLTPQQQQQVTQQASAAGVSPDAYAQALYPNLKPISTPQAVNPYTSDMVANAQGAANSAIGGQQNFINALQGQNGIQNQSNVFNQLQGVANGTGPNPAQAMLANATGANTANQAALMAGQRGAGANAGLIARQAAQQGAANQQNAAGQGAALQANQSLNALGQMGNISGQQVGNLAGANNALTQATLANQAAQMGALQGQNNQITGYQQQSNQLNQQTQAQNAANANSIGTSLLGGALGAAGSALSSALGAEGGAVDDMPKSSEVHPVIARLNSYAKGGPIKMARGGKVPALLSPGERYLSPKAVKEVEKGKDPMKAGEKIPGKPKVSGAKNSYANDIVPKTLDEGGIVLPRSVTQAKNPHWAAHKFVSEIMRKKGSLK